jgi:CheY-like chemotaxis protein
MMQESVLIMLIEDDEDDALLFKEAVSEITPVSQVHYFNNWKNAKDYLSAGSTLPDIIFIDFLLPGKSGIDFAKEIREDKKFQGPLVLLSGIGAHVQGATQYFDAIISKPSNYDMLVSLLKQVMHEHVPGYIRKN